MNPTILYWIIGLFLLYQAYRGWKLGPVRILVRIGGLAAAYMAGYLLGGSVGPLFSFTGYPNFVLSVLGGVAVGLVAYWIILFVGSVLFKKTSDQEYGLTWLLYGVTGSFLGLAWGAIFLYLFAIGLQLVGSFAEGATARKGEEVQEGTFGHRVVALKRALDEVLPRNGLARKLDPIPEQTYVLIQKLGRLASSTEALSRFSMYPGVADLATNPKIQALKDDPEIAEAIRQRRFFQLLRHPLIVKTANDPKLNEQLRKFDLEKALDYAIGEEIQPSAVTPVGAP